MNSKTDLLLQNFETAMQQSWTGTLSIQERMYFLVYDPAEQRKIDLRLGDFENAAVRSGKKWAHISLDKLFSQWMAANEYREAFFEDPEALIDLLEGDFKDHIISYITAETESLEQDRNMLVAITEISALFGFCRLSDILNAIQSDFPGRILIFFPGEFDKNHYRLLDARDGWNYLATPITMSQS